MSHTTNYAIRSLRNFMAALVCQRMGLFLSAALANNKGQCDQGNKAHD